MLRRALCFCALGAATLAAVGTRAEPPLPIFDAHVHYNLDIGRPLPIEGVLDTWRRAGIRAVLLNSRPNDGTRELLAAAPPDIRAVAFARPYVVADDVKTWFKDPGIYAMIERELDRGIYRGHDADSDGFRRFVDLAGKRSLWLHCHCDDYVIDRIFALDPGAHVIWAHTGMNTPLPRVDELLSRYPGLYGELAYREGITRREALSPEWRSLFLKYPKRFLLGSDTWTPQRWPDVPAIMDGYRAWLSQLPREVAEDIAWRNGERLFFPR